MKLTPITLVLPLALMLSAETPKPKEPKYMAAADALKFVESAAVKFQSSDQTRGLETQLEVQRAAAKSASDRFDSLVDELRKKAAVSKDCQPIGTGNDDPAKRYAWQCPEPPPTVTKPEKK